MNLQLLNFKIKNLTASLREVWYNQKNCKLVIEN